MNSLPPRIKHTQSQAYNERPIIPWLSRREICLYIWFCNLVT